MINCFLIGDELHYRGERVAILVQSGVCATTMGDFTDELEAGLLNEDERPDPCSCAHMKECPNYKAEDASNTDGATYEEVMKDLTHNLTPFARGGLIKLSDVGRIVKELIEEKGLE